MSFKFFSVPFISLLFGFLANAAYIDYAPYTTGGVLFGGVYGQITQDNSNLFWDDNNNYLGIGTATPTNPLTIIGPASNSPPLYAQYNGVNASNNGRYAQFLSPNNPAGSNMNIQFGETSSTYYNSVFLGFNYIASASTSNFFSMGFYGNQDILNVFGTGQVGVGTVSPAYTLDVSGTSGASSYSIKGSTSGSFTQSATATVTTYGVVHPSAQGAVNTYERNDGAGNLTWTVPQIANSETSSSTAYTCNTTAGTVTGMSTTPVAGTYLAIYSSDFSSANGGTVVTLQYTVGGTALSISQRKFMPFSGGTLTSGSQRITAGLNSIITFSGSQALTVSCQTSANTVTTANSQLDLVRLQ